MLKIPLAAITVLLLVLECPFCMATITGYCQEKKDASHAVTLVLRHGFTAEGAPTPEWRAAIHDRHDEKELARIMASTRRLSREEVLWLDLITGKIRTWPALIDSLSIPFQGISLRDTVAILLGNLGGEDAFIAFDSTICFDLNKLHHYYGSASANGNSARIDRFFSHELTHLFHKAWRKKNHLELGSPFEFALWECLTEGLGNYRSLTDKWLQQGGKLTPHAREVMNRLQPIFVDRIAALQTANQEEAVALMEGLSSGAFDKKWGALPVALWLAQEAQGDDRNLRKWVEGGPPAVLILAEKYLPENLKGGLPKTER